MKVNPKTGRFAVDQIVVVQDEMGEFHRTPFSVGTVEKLRIDSLDVRTINGTYEYDPEEVKLLEEVPDERPTKTKKSQIEKRVT